MVCLICQDSICEVDKYAEVEYCEYLKWENEKMCINCSLELDKTEIKNIEYRIYKK
jgi:hypothetical protein